MTKGYGGRQIIKRIDVHTNDPQHPNVQLIVKGKVEKFVTIRPRRVRLSGVVGNNTYQTVAVIPEKAYPFEIVETKASPGKNITVSIEKKQGETGPEYQMIVKNIRQQPGQYSETISIKTDNKVKPVLEIKVYGNITAPKVKPPVESGSSSTVKNPVE
ncbi:MAG: hypothetical protein DSY90_01225 [Deltaproteobacteria bacterium]|nr:MAG: hypothetical protein DSY90_01225 [Deltaproteobacteria bacterium]